MRQTHTHKKKLLYVLSLGHSGSTLLDILLSERSGIMGLGEVYMILDGNRDSSEGTKHYCSCGKSVEECSVWGAYDPLGRGLDAEEYSSEYKKVLELPEVRDSLAIVDSSKRLTSLGKLRPLIGNGYIDVHGVLLLRDPRGWVPSYKAALRREKQKQQSWPRLLLWWRRRNRAMKKYFEEHNIPYTVVTYEELCLNQEQTIDRILQDAGIDVVQPVRTKAPTTHVAHGNRMKSSFRDKGVVYDDRWKKSFTARTLGQLFLWAVPSWGRYFRRQIESNPIGKGARLNSSGDEG